MRVLHNFGSLFYSHVDISRINGQFSLSTGDLLENYCHKDDLMNAARFAFCVTIMFTYPIECFVVREVSG